MRCSGSLPSCRRDGNAVHVTLELDSFDVPSRTPYVVWGVGGNVTHASKVEGPLATCSVPESVFMNGNLFKIEVLPVLDPEELVFPWTQIPVLQEHLFEARLIRGEPVLVPLVQSERPSLVVSPGTAF